MEQELTGTNARNNPFDGSNTQTRNNLVPTLDSQSESDIDAVASRTHEIEEPFDQSCITVPPDILRTVPEALERHLEPHRRAFTNVVTGPDQEFDRRIVVYGGGNYGAVVASLFAARGNDVTVAVTSGRGDIPNAELQERADALNQKYAYFSGGLEQDGTTPKGKFVATADHQAAFEGRGMVIYAAPSTGVNEFAERFTPAPGTKIVSVAKGFCFDGWQPDLGKQDELMQGPPKNGDVGVSTPLVTLRRSWRDVPDIEYAVVAGPGFADKIEAGKPSGLVIASQSKELRRSLFQRLNNLGDQSGPHQRTTFLQTTSDTLGLEIAAGYKNLTAIAAGMALALANPHLNDPVPPGASALDVIKSFDFTSPDILKSLGKREASLLARAVTGRALQIDEPEADPKHRTLLTMISADYDISALPNSRNCEFGVRLVEAARHAAATDTPFTPAEVLRTYKKTVEGIPTAFAAKMLADNLENSIDLPVVNAVVDVLQGKESPRIIIDALLRQQQREQMALDQDENHVPADTGKPRIWPPRI